ncbi:MAG: DUF5305 family protein [Ignisphaera sp.]
MVNKNKKPVFLLILTFIALIILSISTFLVVFTYIREPYTTLEKTLYSYTKDSRFLIRFILKPNQVYDSPMLSAEDNIPIYLNLVNSIVLDYRYLINNLKTSGNLHVVVFLQHPDGWSKKYLENRINFSDIALHKVELSIHDIIDYMENICKQIGVKLSVFNISITSYVMSKVYLGSNEYPDSLTHTVTLILDLIRNRVSVAGPLTQSLVVEEKTKLYIAQTLFGLSIENLRITSAFLLAIGGILIGVSAFVWFRFPDKDPVKEFESKYQSIIVSASRIPSLSGKNVIYLTKLEEIIKISRLLEKPIIKYIERDNNQNRILYTVLDKESVYFFAVPTTIE